MSHFTYVKRPRIGDRAVRLAIIALGVVLVGLSVVSAVRLVGGLVPDEAVDAPKSREERIIADAEETIAQDPNNSRAHWQLSLALSTVRKYTDALRSAETAARLAEATPEPFYALGVAYRGLGDTERAVKAFTKAASIPGAYSDLYREVYYDLGVTHAESGDWKSAIEAYELALSNGPEATYVVLALAEAYEESGDRDRAVQEYLAAMGYDPSSKVAYDALVALGVSEQEIESARNPIAHERDEPTGTVNQ